MKKKSIGRIPDFGSIMQIVKAEKALAERKALASEEETARQIAEIQKRDEKITKEFLERINAVFAEICRVSPEFANRIKEKSGLIGILDTALNRGRKRHAVVFRILSRSGRSTVDCALAIDTSNEIRVCKTRDDTTLGWIGCDTVLPQGLLKRANSLLTPKNLMLAITRELLLDEPGQMMASLTFRFNPCYV